ncbi:cytochrome P450 [Xylaria intraflava]|nr:cytochrome P450 [Xylaria intraflava]
MFTAVTYTGGVFLLYLAALFSYRLLLHPLRSYPGPLLAKVTDAYAGIYALMWRLHLVTYQDHHEYGPVMRYGPDRLIFNTVAAYRDIYRSERVTKSDVYRATQQSKNVYSILNVRDRALHRLKRKLMGRAVSEQSMRSFEPTMAEEVNVFLRKLLDASNSTGSKRIVNMARNCKYLGYDVVGHLAFGYPLRLQVNDEHRFIADANAYGNYRINVFMQWPLTRYTRLERIFELIPSTLRARLLGAIEKMIKARLAQAIDARRDLYYYVAAEFGADPSSLRLGNLWSEAVFFIPAGGDTTSTALSATFFYLSRNPTCYRKLAEEIRTAFQKGADICGGPQLFACRYLRACIDEALRMSPPLPGTLWRELYEDNGEPWVIDGHVIPPGTKVGVNTYSLHHNEEYFPEPFAYVPERWLEDETPYPQASNKAMQDAFAAFSTGARGCGGKAMAYLEASLVVARTLWYFDFEVAPGQPGKAGCGFSGAANGRERETEYQLYDVFISIHDGPNLIFKQREDFCKDL